MHTGSACHTDGHASQGRERKKKALHTIILRSQLSCQHKMEKYQPSGLPGVHRWRPMNIFEGHNKLKP